MDSKRNVQVSVNGREDLGKLKPLLEPLAKKKKGFIDGGKDPNYQEALKEWAKQSDIREGRRIGVLPYGVNSFWNIQTLACA